MTDYGWEYVFHCHYLDHEENDMMRPMVFDVTAATAPTNLSGRTVTAAIPPSTNGVAAYRTWAGDPSASGFTVQG